MPIEWVLVGIALVAIMGTGAVFGFAFWTASNNLDVEVRTARHEPKRSKLRAGTSSKAI
jgi:hypothetical protein